MDALNSRLVELERRNNALNLNNPGNRVNGATAQIAITTRGSDWYFAVCAVMTVAGIAFMGLALRKPRHHRVFHYLTSAVVFTAAIAYFTMGSNLGFTPIQVEFPRSDPKVAGQVRDASPYGHTLKFSVFNRLLSNPHSYTNSQYSL